MNWELVGWFGGAILTLTGIKIVWTLFRTLFSKKSIVRMIGSVESGAQRSAERISDNLADKVKDARERRREARERERQKNKPEVYVR